MMNRQTLLEVLKFTTFVFIPSHLGTVFFFVENSTCGIFATEGGGLLFQTNTPRFFWFAHPVRAEFFAGFFCQTQQ